MRFLIIYNAIPENVKLYTLDTEDTVLIRKAQEIHNTLSDDDTEINKKIEEVIQTSTAIFDSDDSDASPIISGDFMIINTGCIL